MKLKDKVALITGASSGIGRATAVLFAKEGAKVVVADIDEEGADETVKLIKKDGGEAIAVKTDVTKEKDVEKAVKVIVENYGKLDILFNNAGISIIDSLIDVREDTWDRVMSVNLKGVFLCSKYTIPQMMKQGGGVIINAGSEAGLLGHTDYTTYCASKGGVIALTRAMAVELGKYNIRVNCTCPGVILTPLVERETEILSKQSMRTPEELLKGYEKMAPLGRIGKPKDVALAALFLASEESSFITGACLPIDGGYLAGEAF